MTYHKPIYFKDFAVPVKCHEEKKKSGNVGHSLELHCYSGAKTKGYTGLSLCNFWFKLGSIHSILHFMLKAKKKKFSMLLLKVCPAN